MIDSISLYLPKDLRDCDQRNYSNKNYKYN